jgi:carboxylesterase
MSRGPADASVVAPCEPFRFEGGPVGILLQHGFSGCPASMRPFGRWLSERGFSVAGPRWPGHGTANWEDLAGHPWGEWERATGDALAELSSRCACVVAVGLSVGGGMVLHLAATRPEQVQGVVAINALVRRPELALAPLLSRVVGSVKAVGNDIKKPGTDEVCAERIPTAAVAELGRFLRVVDGELPRVSVPLLVFSSDDDHTVKPANSRRIAERCGSDRKDLIRLTNSYHVATLDHDAPAVFDRVAAFAGEVASATAADPA